MTRMPSILLIDDDATFRERLARALRSRGCHVVTTPDHDTARHHAQIGHFDGAILDLRLHAGSGLDLIPALKTHQPAMRIVVLTGFGSIVTAMDAGRLGATEYFTKPVDVDQLHAALVPDAANPAPVRAPSTGFPSLDRVEWEHIQRVLTDCGGNVSRAARLLGIDRRSLQRKLGKHPPPR